MRLVRFPLVAGFATFSTTTPFASTAAPGFSSDNSKHVLTIANVLTVISHSASERRVTTIHSTCVQHPIDVLQ